MTKDVVTNMSSAAVASKVESKVESKSESKSESKEKEKEKPKTPENEIRVTRQTLIRTYLGYIATLFQAKQDTIVIRGTGYVIPKANALAALTRRRFKGLHQITEISTVDMPNLASITEKEAQPELRKVALLTITLSTKELDKAHPGYSPPLPDSQVTEYVPAVRAPGPSYTGPRKGMRRGRGRGRGFGRRYDEWAGYPGEYYVGYYPGGR